MSQTVITQAFEQLKAQEAANGGVVTLDEFVFASVPNLNITDPIDRDEGLPPAAQIVHRQAVSKTGMVNSNAVVYSVVLGADVGDFEFNWVGLLNKASGVVAMIVHAPSQKKIRTQSGQQGNVLTRSFLMEYNGASEQTQIITPADTWQIDFTARLDGVDERVRIENIDTYGSASFLDDGFLVSGANGKYLVNKGAAYIEGLRAELLFDQELTVASRPSKIWVDVCWRGTLTSTWKPVTKLTIAETLSDYMEGDEQHYVYAVAQILADGSILDLRQASVIAQISGLLAEPDTVPYFDKNAKLQKSALSTFIRELLAIQDADGVMSHLGLSNPLHGDRLISVQQTLNGAVQRTQHEKNAESVSVEDFGAKGDGEHDDTEAFVKANEALDDGAYLKLIPGKNYKITGIVFTKRISMGCYSGRSSITSETGLKWKTLNTDLNVDVDNIDLIPSLAPNQNAPTFALEIEVTNKNFGSAGFARISGVSVKRPGVLAFYSGIRVKNQPVIIEGGDIVLLQSHTNAAAKDGSLANWAINSGDGVLLDSATYSVVRNVKVYYAQNAFRATGQIEEVHFRELAAFNNRRCYVFEGLTGSANEQRIWGCHGVTYLDGIDLNSDGVSRISLCSVGSSSILAASDATAAKIVYLAGWLDGATINSFQAFNNGTRGANDIAVWLKTVNGVGTRRVIIDGLHMRGVGTGIYLDSNERQHITNVSSLQVNMVGSSPVIYAYGPNNTSAPVSTAFGLSDQENVFPATTTAPRLLATGYLGLKTENSVNEPGVERFRIRELSSNYRFESADASGTLQYNAGIDQGGSFRSKGIYPLAANAYTFGTASLAWAGGFTQTAFTVTSDERAKTEPLEIEDAMLDAWSEVGWRQYKLLDRVQSKGEAARWHHGVIAQRVVEAFERHGLDAHDYGLLCYDEWESQPEVLDHHEATPAVYDESGEMVRPAMDAYSEVVTPAIEAGSGYSIRYLEALALEAELQRRNYERLLGRIEALENK